MSGSMAGTKLSNLKKAAIDFVETVTEGDEEHHVSVGIVPYNAQVNALRVALAPDIRVGTVDKFQGQEAAIAVSSAATAEASGGAMA